jgi:hypothetical protein
MMHNGGFARRRPEAVTTLRDRLLNWCENFYQPVVGHTVARPATSGWNQPGPQRRVRKRTWPGLICPGWPRSVMRALVMAAV